LAVGENQVSAKSPAADSLTILSSSSKFSAKQFSRQPDGTIKNRGYDHETHFAVETVPVDDIKSLAHSRRLLHADKKNGDPATFGEQARHHFIADIDHIVCPAAINPRGDPEGAVEYAIGLLPPELHDASCWWQLSCSQSVFDDITLSIHLWFWSEQALSSDELKRWGSEVNRVAGYKLVDTSLYTGVQPHYTSAPIFKNLPDPLPRRTGFRQGLDDDVSLLIPPPDPKHADEPFAGGWEPGKGTEAYIAAIGGPEGFREPIKNAIASFVAIHGSKADATALKAAIRAAVLRADAGGRARQAIDRYADEDHLDAILQWVRAQQGDRPGVAARQAAADDAILELNKTYAVVQVTNKAAILKEHLDAEGKPTFSLLPPESFRLLLANRFIGADPVSKIWLADFRRRQYDGITFAPERSPSGYYNLWRGLAVEPSERGSCELFKKHLLENVCRNDDGNYRWVFGWFADIFQHPANKCGTACVVRGKMGVGKTIVGEAFGHLLGSHYVQVADPRYVTGRFNAHLVRCLLFHCDEAFWAGDRASEGKLKDLVTGKRHPIELKGYEVFFVSNYVRMFINGNPDWLVPAGMEERRFATFDAGSEHIQDIPYFKAIVDELEDGGYERLLYELLNFDLSTVDLRTIPKTAALLDQKIETLTPERAWWLDILKNGRLPWCDLVNPAKSPGRALFNSYIKHAKTSGVFRRKIETAIGMFIRGVVPKDGLSTKVERYTYPTPLGGIEEDRGTVYTFPPLAECREAFDGLLGQKIQWDEPTVWDVRSTSVDDAEPPF
jgi:hypothetical protein